MEVQLKKGLLDTLILSTLRREDSYGYKIVQDIQEVMPLSESTLYPVLRRLEGGGCLKTYTRAYNGRLRKYYSITRIGQRKIDLFLEDWQLMENVYRFIKERNI